MKDNSTAFIAGLLIGCISTVCVLWAHGTRQPTMQERMQSPHSPARVVRARVTAYCPCSICCGKFADGKTSRGRDAHSTRGVAVDPKVISYGSMVTIPGYGTFEADDTGSAMKRGDQIRIDLRFPTHQEALNFGVKTMEVTIR